MIAFLLKNWQGALGIIGALVLSTLLVIQKGETRHWHKQSDNYERLYHDDQAAFAKTVADYRAAAEKARADDKANAERVLAEQAANTKQRDQSYEARIADARARAERLQQQLTAATHPGSPGAAGVSGGNGSAGGPHGPASEAGLPPSDALIATEQAIQLDELQRWVKGLLGINRTAPVSSPSSPSGNR